MGGLMENVQLISFLNDITNVLKDKYKELSNVDNKFSLLMLQLTAILQNSRELKIEKPLNVSDFEILRAKLLQFVHSLSPLQRRFILLQLYYKQNARRKDEIVGVYEKEIENRCLDLRDWIVKNVPKYKKSEKELFYKKLLTYIILTSDMGFTNDPQVIKQTEVALRGIFDMEEIPLLYHMPGRERDIEIGKIAAAANGRRLYLREVSQDKLYSAGILNVLELVPKRLYDCATLLTSLREVCIDKLIRYTTLLRPYFLHNDGERKNVSYEISLIRTGLALVHQILIYVKNISTAITIEDDLFETVSQEYATELAELKQVFGEREVEGAAALQPIFLSFPKLGSLAESWKKMQESARFLDTRIELITTIRDMSEKDLAKIENAFGTVSNISRFPSENQFFNLDHSDKLNMKYNANIAVTEFLPDMDIRKTTFVGFCPWALVHGDGLLILSNPHLGVLSRDGRSFLVSSPQALHDFSVNPSEYLNEAISVCRRFPELIMLLRAEKLALNPKLGTAVKESKTFTSTVTYRSRDIQTVLHPIKSNIVKGYSSNEWDLRRSALSLVKLNKCRTSSTQTYQQALKPTIGVQTYETRNIRLQTNQDKASEIPTSQFFFWGLRGKRPDPPHIVELIRETPLRLPCLTPKKRSGRKNKCA